MQHIYLIMNDTIVKESFNREGCPFPSGCGHIQVNIYILFSLQWDPQLGFFFHYCSRSSLLTMIYDHMLSFCDF